MQTVFTYIFLLSLLILSDNLYANKTEDGEINHSLKLNKDGIKVYIFSHKNSSFGTFKAITHINASLDSILAVMLDSNSRTEWVDACEKSMLIKNISFYERYHYQILDIPFPFINRDFIFHSIMEHNPSTNAVTITMSSVPDYCIDKKFERCEEVNQSKLVRVNKSIGTFKLEPSVNGTKITWIQHTDPAGNLPSWLVNQFVKGTPYWTFKKLAKIVKKERYKFAKLIYDINGVAIALNNPVKIQEKPFKKAKDFVIHPTF
jgi:hypothetical protein